MAKFGKWRTKEDGKQVASITLDVREMWTLRSMLFHDVTRRAEDPKAQALFEGVTAQLGFPVEDD